MEKQVMHNAIFCHLMTDASPSFPNTEQSPLPWSPLQVTFNSTLYVSAFRSWCLYVTLYLWPGFNQKRPET